MLKKKHFCWGRVKSTLAVSASIAFTLPISAPARAAQAASAGAAESTFKSTCAACYSADGSGNTPVGKSMQIPDLHSPQVQSQSDEQLSEAINNMPPFKGSLRPDQIHQLVAHVRELGQKQ